MKTLLALACLVLLSSLPASAQTGPRSGAPSTTTTGGYHPQPSTGDVPTSAGISLSGKVVLDDGSALPDAAFIQTICKGLGKRTETHTDLHGSFSFQFSGAPTSSNDIGVDAETSSRNNFPGRPERHNLQDCQLQATLPGFTSDVVELSRFRGSEYADIGRVVLHRLKNVEGFTISATTAQAPAAARKALEKGLQLQQQGKLDDAQKSFEKAVAMYPKFAAAWSELGRVQMQKNDSAGARYSFQQSIAADPKYVNPYLGLIPLAQREQKWQELDDVSDKLLALDPVSFPEVWLSNTVAKYYLGNFAEAEKSARQGLQVDPEHRVPKLEYVLGMVLVKKPDYPDAARHLQAFLSLTTQPAEVAEAQKQLAEIARLVNPPVSEKK